MFLILFTSGCLWLLAFLSLLSKKVSELRASVLAYGKLNTTADQPTSNWAGYLRLWTVPKSWFAHFYVVGLLFSMYCWLELSLAMTFKEKGQAPLLGPLLLSLQKWDSSRGSQSVNWSVCLYGLFLLTLHLARRLYESWFIEKPSPLARMHLSHYLVGFGFYGAMVFGTWLEGVAVLPIWQDYNSTSRSFCYHDIPIATTSIGTVLFLYASKHQYSCHCILASLRTNNKENDDGKSNSYRIPHGDWFEFLVAPHYTCDVLIYLSLCIIYQAHSIILLSGLFWTFLNLSVTASETKSWYIATFPTYPKRRWIMVPGLF
ncbi:unnamed protein product [Absidia cylindrospora]